MCIRDSFTWTWPIGRWKSPAGGHNGSHQARSATKRSTGASICISTSPGWTPAPGNAYPCSRSCSETSRNGVRQPMPYSRPPARLHPARRSSAQEHHSVARSQAHESTQPGSGPRTPTANAGICPAKKTTRSAWAIVEVLHATGIRAEELHELSHHSLVQYRLPGTGEVVPLLQIMPSKTDAERLLVISPDLADVFAAIIRRVSGPTGLVPLVSGYDNDERVWCSPAPRLLQRRICL